MGLSIDNDCMDPLHKESNSGFGLLLGLQILVLQVFVNYKAFIQFLSDFIFHSVFIEVPYKFVYLFPTQLTKLFPKAFRFFSLVVRDVPNEDQKAVGNLIEVSSLLGFQRMSGNKVTNVRSVESSLCR